MNSKSRITSCILLVSLFGMSALPAAAASQDEFFWKELQRTDGYRESDAAPVPRGATGNGGTSGATVQHDAFIIELQKTDGFVADAVVRPADTRERKTQAGSKPKRSL